MAETYQPHPGTLAARALEFISVAGQSKPKGEWIANLEVCAALGCLPNLVRPSLDRAIEVGIVEKSLDTRGFTQWRIPVSKPRRASKATAKAAAPAQTFSIPNWPPGFVSRFDTVKVASYEERRK